ncbi:NADH-quinone oxidoreductase subunit N [Actinoallomurus iriomotensis]|uniref:NADH-quinone oxidoreductase subunit N n=1 Tax=Actinoallomurus iriomotensis TaxID=478107 RepID=A0A9W6W530_9ACTN|nr:NADH-quinone oxidoreductase subunit N [Actinoallomurus iriomotensis]GLY91074.1 NADH-quinone oxidoreductase subunit N [Actinoallomurus iriomotensis]
MIQTIDYLAILPTLIVAVGSVVVLMADAFGTPRRVTGLLTVLILAAAAVALVPGHGRTTFCTGPSCSYVADDFATLFQAIVLLTALVVVLLSHGEIGRSALPAGEYHFLLLAAVTGALLLASGRDLITLVVALETLSLPVFALVALRRYDGVASEAALKLFLVSVVSSAVTLFGISLVYGVTGAMHLDRVAAGLTRVPADLKPVAAVGVVAVIAGFGFKVAAVPFHFWAPDVYQGAPLPVAAFLSVVSKAGGFAGLTLVLTAGFWPLGGTWGPLLGVLAAATMTLGNLLAMRQRDVVRLLAWSSVAQSGFMLAPLAGGTRVRPHEWMTATAAYVAMYAIMNIGAFAVVTVVARRGRRDLGDYRGLARANPGVAIALAFFLVCLAGLPPGVMGLFAKVVVFKAAIGGAATWLAVIMAVNTVLGLYYYLGWAARLFTPAERAETVRVGRTGGIAIAVSLAGALVVSAAPELVLHAAALAVP